MPGKKLDDQWAHYWQDEGCLQPKARLPSQHGRFVLDAFKGHLIQKFKGEIIKANTGNWWLDVTTSVR
jgi:hypothetical protein